MKRLIGYFTGTADPAALRAQLAERLPAYMIPAALIALAALPLTSNGKVDTRALPAPDYTSVDRYRAPATPTEEILAGIYAEVLGLERVGVDDSFFELGGDSIASMQVVARARAAGLACRPRDVFVEQTVARLARVALPAQGEVADEGIGAVPATPIMGWLASLEGPTEQFNQTLVLQAPTGVTHTEVEMLVQALLDRHAMLRAHLNHDPAGWSLTVPEAGAVPAGQCLQVVPAVDEQALIAARTRLNPATGVMLVAVWASATGQLALIIHHLVIDAVSWRVLLDDLNTAWTQQRAGQPVVLPVTGTSFARWAQLLGEYAHRPEVLECADTWKQLGSAPAILPAPQPTLDTYATAEHLVVSLDPDTTEALLGEVPAAFHTGIHEILLIALGMAIAQFVGNGAAPISIDVEGHGRHDELDELDTHLDLSHTVGWFTTKYPVTLTVGRLRWPQITAGDAELGTLIKHAKEQLRALPHPLSYGALRYLNPDIDLPDNDPPIGFNYLGRLSTPTGTTREDLWRLDQHAISALAATAAIPMPLGHTLELNAATLDTDTGPQLQATWTWAPTALDHTAVTELSQLWFEALTGICTNVRTGGGGLTPSDVVAPLSQQQIEKLQRRYANR